VEQDFVYLDMYDSDVDSNSYVMDNYTVSDDICDIHWWGYGDPVPETGFTITFYQDDFGQPGIQLDQKTVTANVFDTGVLIGGTEPVYYFEASWPDCVTVHQGWISVRGMADGNTFLWYNSSDGDELIWYYFEPDYFIEQTDDMAFCLTAAAPTPIPTDTPLPTDTPTPFFTDTPTPFVTDTATPLYTDTPTPFVTDTATPLYTDTPTPFVTDTPTPIIGSPTQTPCIRDGDITGDGQVTAADAQQAFMIAIGAMSPTPEQECAADCNGIDGVTAGDAQLIFMTAIGQGACVDSSS